MNSQREKVTNYWREKICVFNFLYYNTCALWREARPVQSRELFVSFVFKERKRIFSVVVHTQCKSTRKCVRNYRQVKINSNEKKKKK